jgi:hypothetical protein
VEPWMNYIKLMMARPDLKGIDLESLDPKLRTFLLHFQSESDKWINNIDLPKSFRDLDPAQAVHELNIVLGLVLLQTDGKAYLNDLVKRGELPLHYEKHDEAKLREILVDAGRTEDEVAAILHGSHRG